MRTNTKPVMVIQGKSPLRAADFNNHARAIEELQRAAKPLQKRRPDPTRKRLPFEIRCTDTDIYAMAGSINGIEHEKEIVEDPANGVWEFLAKVVIDSETGEIIETDVVCVPEETVDNTETDFYGLIGTITVVDGVPQRESIFQVNYGPIIAYPFGAVTERWTVAFI